MTTPAGENAVAKIDDESKTAVYSDSWTDFRRSFEAGLGDSPIAVAVGAQDGPLVSDGVVGVQDTLGVPFPELTPGERRDLRGWNLRLSREPVFSRYYFPEKWEQREMETLRGFLELVESPHTSGQEATRNAVKSIFFPGDHDLKSVLLKRGPVLVDGDEERELMLFTRGFLLSRVGFDALLNLLFTINSENPDYLTPESLQKRFDVVDSDKNGSIDRCELKEAFAGMGVPLSDLTLDDIMARFDADDNGIIEYSEFLAMMQFLVKPKKGGGWSWESLGEKMMSMMHTKDKLECAYQLSEIDRIESLNVCCSKPTKMITHSPLREVTFAIFLKCRDYEKPLLVVCSKPEHRLAWVDALRTCYVKSAQMKADCGCTVAKANQSKVGWQHRAIRASLFSLVVCNDVTGLKEQVSAPSPDIDDIDDQDEYYGYTALHYAVILDHESCAVILMQCGANVNLLDYNHKSPLDHAVLSENEYTIRKLEQHGAKQHSPEVLFKSAVEEQQQQQRLQSSQPASTTSQKIRAKAKRAGGAISEAMSALRMRGERLEGLDNKTAQLQSGAANYAGMAKLLKEKNK